MPETPSAELNEIALKLMEVEKIPRWEELTQLHDHLENENKGLWLKFCKATGVFQAFSYESVKNLAEEIKKLDVTGKIVEVCAGNGKLSYWLRHFNAPSIATDDYSWDISSPKYVERLPHKQAIEKYSPELVIGCWIADRPLIALDVIDSPCVRYYLHIGEGFGGDVEKLWSRRDVTYSYLESVDRFILSMSGYGYATLFRKK